MGHECILDTGLAQLGRLDDKGFAVVVSQKRHSWKREPQKYTHDPFILIANMAEKYNFQVPYMVTFREYSEVVLGKPSGFLTSALVYLVLFSLAAFAARHHWSFYILALAFFVPFIGYVLFFACLKLVYQKAYGSYEEDAKICRIYINEKSINLYRGIESNTIEWNDIVGFTESSGVLFLKTSLVKGVAVRKSALGEKLDDLRHLLREKKIL